MTNTIEVETSIGKFVLVKPKAGVRNRALAKAETDSGRVKESVLMAELLPSCVMQRPEHLDKDIPIADILDELEIEDFDKLFLSLTSLINPEAEEKKTS